MPRRDGTGPSGQGPLTGRRMGSCSTGNRGRNIGIALGVGLGLGLRRGFRKFWQRNNSMDELNELKEEASILQENLTRINERISQLENKE